MKNRILVLALVVLAACNSTRYSETTFFVSPQLYTKPASQKLEPQLTPAPACTTSCLEVRQDGVQTPFTLYQDQIKGFAFQAGFRYTLKIRIGSTDTPSGCCIVAYSLLDILEKTPAQ
jgi:hypothetical protein